MSFPKKVLSVLWGIVDHMAENCSPYVKDPTRDFTRSRKLGFVTLIRFLISMQTGCINHELLKFFRFHKKDTPSASAFIQQRAKLRAEAFRYILDQFNRSFPLTKFRKKYSLIAVDGSTFQIFRDPDDPSTFHPPGNKSKRGFNTVHAVALYDLLSRKYLDMVFQRGRFMNEYRAMCDLVGRFRFGRFPIFIADRGFASYNVYAHAIANDAFFIIRVRDNNTKGILGVPSLPNSLDTWVHLILSRSGSRASRLHPELSSRYRTLVKSSIFDFISEDCPEYPLSLRVVRFRLPGGNFENIVTNLPADTFPAPMIRYLYSLRWGQETSFRDLKKTIGTCNFHSKDPQYIEFEIFSRMILYNFCTLIAMKVPVHRPDGKWIYQVNLSMAIKICISFLTGGLSSVKVNGLIGRYILPVRPDRSYDRIHRFQKPASFAYRFI